jgi:RNA polymerase sigma-70 factor (ECF subfamily)
VDDQPADEHLSEISTVWTMVFQAHGSTVAQTASAAREMLLERYCGAVHRYLVAAVRDPHVAGELSQEFALGFVEGKFRNADPDKGRFRDYVKTALFNLIRKHHKKQSRQPVGLDLALAEPAAPQETAESDETFLSGWRDELLARVWEALARIEAQTGQMYFTMLDYRARHKTSSAQMAEKLSHRLGKKLTAAGVRQTVHRGRDKFADLLIEEVARSLETDQAEPIEQELIDLGLMSYCKDALARRFPPQK